MATPVRMPKQGNSVESCVILEWKKLQGEAIRQGEVLCEVETDKAVMEIESPDSGVVLAQLFAAGDEVPVQTVIAVIGEPGEAIEPFANPGVKPHSIEAQALASSPRLSPVNTPTLPHSDHAKPISPRARHLARQAGLSFEGLVGSGPGGRVIERDVQARAMLMSPTPPSYPGASAIPLKGIRKRTAERMLESLQSTAQLTLNASADARSLLEWRAKLKASSDAELGLISLNDLILFAVARSLISHPQLNCWLENHTLQQFSRVNLGFAVDTPRGLLVPVVKEAQGLGLRELARQTKQLAAKCQEGHIEPQALQDGTFTVSNLGQFGIEQFTPILYPPQVGILGVGSINLKPIQTPTGIEFQPHLALSLTVNHQAVDGAPAARFLQSLSHNLADLTLLLALGA